MDKRWFVQSKGKEWGPYSAERLRKMAADGKLLPETRIRPEDMVFAGPARIVFKEFFPCVSRSELQIDEDDDELIVLANEVPTVALTHENLSWDWLNDAHESPKPVVVRQKMDWSPLRFFLGHVFTRTLNLCGVGFAHLTSDGTPCQSCEGHRCCPACSGQGCLSCNGTGDCRGCFGTGCGIMG